MLNVVNGLVMVGLKASVAKNELGGWHGEDEKSEDALSPSKTYTES